MKYAKRTLARKHLKGCYIVRDLELIQINTTNEKDLRMSFLKSDMFSDMVIGLSIVIPVITAIIIYMTVKGY